MKLNLIYYKCILDAAIEKIVSSCEDMFQKDGSKYVLGLNASKSGVMAIAEQCIDECIANLISSISSKDVLLVIGSCYPKDSLLMQFKDDTYFPRKLQKLIEAKPCLKWLLSEKDIEIDIDLFNEVFVGIFNKKFKQQSSRKCSSISQKAVFVSHRQLDCYAMFKTIKWAYGNSNCCNAWKSMLDGQRCNLIAVNDLISKYVHNKNRMNKSAELKKCALEVKEYLDKILQLG